MSADNIWDRPDVAAAVEHLKATVFQAVGQPADGSPNVMISVVTDKSEMEIYYEGCNCPKCATATIRAISQEVFGIKSEVVRTPKTNARPSRVH
jgi:hypothetical protein